MSYHSELHLIHGFTSTKSLVELPGHAERTEGDNGRLCVQHFNGDTEFRYYAKHGDAVRNAKGVRGHVRTAFAQYWNVVEERWL